MSYIESFPKDVVSGLSFDQMMDESILQTTFYIVIQKGMIIDYVFTVIQMVSHKLELILYLSGLKSRVLKFTYLA